MNIVAHVHMYPPEHNAGAEWMLHTLLRELVKRGHAARVLASHAPNSYEFDGVEVVSGGELMLLKQPERDVYAGADVAVTHLDQTRAAIELARETRVPLTHLVHNAHQLRANRVETADCSLAVFNAEATQREARWVGPQIVVTPPVFASDYRTETTREFVTLLNLNENKGGHLLWEVAKLLPRVKFLGVRGAYGYQVLAPLGARRLAVPEMNRPTVVTGGYQSRVQVVAASPSEVRNVVIAPNTSNVRGDVYARTGLLLMPSEGETWGRVAVEAAASGIPTLCHETTGLREAMGAGATFVPDLEPETWARAIEDALEPQRYGELQRAATLRSAELDPTPHIDLFEASLLKIVRGRERGSLPPPSATTSSP